MICKQDSQGTQLYSVDAPPGQEERKAWSTTGISGRGERIPVDSNWSHISFLLALHDSMLTNLQSDCSRNFCEKYFNGLEITGP